MKKISIITVNRNNESELRKTIASVERYAPESCEYIVIDGASTDGSVAAIEASRRIAMWISEPDSGIYNAMNKGIAQATGNYLLFLNSGDCLREDNGLDALPDNFPEVIYADAIVVNRGRRQVIRYPESLDVNYFIGGMINHQNALVRRDLFTRLGFYDDSLKICADWLFFLKAAHVARARFVHVPKTMVEFAGEGLSSRLESEKIIRREMRAGIVSVFGDLAPSILELQEYRNTVYGDIVRRFGSGRVLDTLLRGYRFFIRRIRVLMRA